jgi:hypothetical protein
MLRKIVILLMVLLALLLICAGVVWWLLGNERFLKQQAAGAVFDLTGRELVIDGPLELQLGAMTTLKAREVSLSNAAWASGGDMLQVGSLDVTVDVRTLFSDRLHFMDIAISDADVRLSRNEEGQANWDMLAETGSKEDTEAPADQLPFRIERLKISDFSVVDEAPSRQTPLQVIFNELLFERRSDGELDLDVTGSVDGQSLELRGVAGPVNSLIHGGAFSHELVLNLGDIVLNSKGSARDALNWTGITLDVNFSGPEFGWLTESMDLPAFSSGPFDFNLLIDEGAGNTEIDLKGDLGTLEIVVDGEVDRLTDPTEALVELSVNGPDLQSIGETFGVENLPALPYQLDLDADLETGKGRIKNLVVKIDSDRLEIEGVLGSRPEFYGSQLSFRADGSDLRRWGPVMGVEGLSHRPFSLAGDISSDQVGLLNARAELKSGGEWLHIEGFLGSPPGFEELKLDLSFRSEDPGQITLLPGHERFPAVPVSLSGNVARTEQGLTLEDVQLETQGNSLYVDGLVSLGDRFLGSSLNATVEIPSVAALGRLFELSDLPKTETWVNSSFHWRAFGLTPIP